MLCETLLFCIVFRPGGQLSSVSNKRLGGEVEGGGRAVWAGVEEAAREALPLPITTRGDTEDGVHDDIEDNLWAVRSCVRRSKSLDLLGSRLRNWVIV